MLHRFHYETTPMLATLAVVLLLGFAPGAQAQDHVVLPADLHHEVLTASRARQQNLAKVQKFFGEEAVKKALKRGKRLKANIKITAKDRAGNARAETAIVRLLR